MCVIKNIYWVYYFSRGAAGRLMKLEEVKLLLDDLGIPLQIGISPSTKNDIVRVFCPVYIHSSFFLAKISVLIKCSIEPTCVCLLC